MSDKTAMLNSLANMAMREAGIPNSNTSSASTPKFSDLEVGMNECLNNMLVKPEMDENTKNNALDTLAGVLTGNKELSEGLNTLRNKETLASSVQGCETGIQPVNASKDLSVSHTSTITAKSGEHTVKIVMQESKVLSVEVVHDKGVLHTKVDPSLIRTSRVKENKTPTVDSKSDTVEQDSLDLMLKLIK